MTYHSEHFLVAELRDTAAYIPELSLVAEVQEEIVGHVLLTKILPMPPPAPFYRIL